MTKTIKIVQPFGETYWKNEDKHGDRPCALCGRECKSDNGIPDVQIIDGGSDFGPADYADNPETLDHDSYMGCYPVGPTCARKHRAFFTSLGYTIK